MLKKYLAIISALVLTMSLASGCGLSDWIKKKDKTKNESSSDEAQQDSDNAVEKAAERAAEKAAEKIAEDVKSDSEEADSSEAAAPEPDSGAETPEQSSQQGQEGSDGGSPGGDSQKKISNDYNISIVDQYFDEDYNGNTVLCLEYEFTNTSDETASFALLFNEKVFQNGIECLDSYGRNTKNIWGKLDDVEPGQTYTVEAGYIINDKTDVEIEIWDLYGNGYYFSDTLELGDGPSKVYPAENTEDTYIKIVDQTMSKDYEDKDVLVLTYEYHNGSGEDLLFGSFFYDKALQNNKQCSNLVIGCDEVNNSERMISIRPGVTNTIKVGYLIEDKSEVEVTVTSLVHSTEYLKETIKP